MKSHVVGLVNAQMIILVRTAVRPSKELDLGKYILPENICMKN